MTTPRNRVQLTGHLGNDPEIKTIDSGKKVAKFSMATNESYKNNKGEQITETTWHNIVAWGKTADVVEQQLKKGVEVYVEGKIQSKNYTDKDGTKRFYTDILVNEVTAVGKTATSDTASE